MPYIPGAASCSSVLFIIFRPEKPLLIDHLQIFSKSDMKSYRTGQLFYMLNASGSEFRMTDILSNLISYNTILRVPVLLFSSISIPYRYSTVMDRASELFLIIMFHQSFSRLIIWRWCRSGKGTAIFPGTAVGTVLPLIFCRNVEIMLHVMSILMFIEIR